MEQVFIKVERRLDANSLLAVVEKLRRSEHGKVCCSGDLDSSCTESHYSFDGSWLRQHYEFPGLISITMKAITAFSEQWGDGDYAQARAVADIKSVAVSYRAIAAALEEFVKE